MQAKISASSKSEYSWRISSMVIPLARKSRINETQIRCSRMQGLSKQTFGSMVIRDSNSALFIRMLPFAAHFLLILQTVSLFPKTAGAFHQSAIIFLPLPFLQQINPLANSLSHRNLVHFSIPIEPKFILVRNGYNYPFGRHITTESFSHPGNPLAFKILLFSKNEKASPGIQACLYLTG
jgi:hypothetical protein